ncbi:MAG: HIT family protein [Bacteroidales bacterium]|jgi:histidine triad (HIT) family protein|nr:HIT family protein [Bacteroidales bacterium]
MSSIFTKIINGEIPCYKVAEDEHHIAFLDISPVAKGHTLVVPKAPIDYIFDMQDDHLAALMLFAKKVAIAMKPNFACLKIGVEVIGLDVPHTHVHLIPISQASDLDFTKQRLSFSEEEYLQIANQIKKSFNK